MTITVTSDYRTNKGTLQSIVDGDSSTYWGAQEGQAAGKNITFSFSGPVTFMGITTKSGSSNGTQIYSGTSLQVSSDGKDWQTIDTFDGQMSCTLSGFYETRVMAVRLYWNAGNKRKLAFYEAEFDIREEHAYRKINGIWVPVKAAYKKTSNRWGEAEDLSEIQHRNVIDRDTV